MGFVRVQSDSQFPLVDGDRGVGISLTGQLNIQTVQVPVSIKALDLHLRFVCKRDTLESIHRLTTSYKNTAVSRDCASKAIAK